MELNECEKKGIKQAFLTFIYCILNFNVYYTKLISLLHSLDSKEPKANIKCNKPNTMEQRERLGHLDSKHHTRSQSSHELKTKLCFKS